MKKQLTALAIIAIIFLIWMKLVYWFMPDTLGGEILALITYVIGGVFVIFKLTNYLNNKADDYYNDNFYD
jgi:nitrate/nitrite transporter NarK